MDKVKRILQGNYKKFYGKAKLNCIKLSVRIKLGSTLSNIKNEMG